METSCECNILNCSIRLCEAAEIVVSLVEAFPFPAHQSLLNVATGRHLHQTKWVSFIIVIDFVNTQAHLFVFLVKVEIGDVETHRKKTAKNEGEKNENSPSRDEPHHSNNLVDDRLQFKQSTMEDFDSQKKKPIAQRKLCPLMNKILQNVRMQWKKVQNLVVFQTGRPTKEVNENRDGWDLEWSQGRNQFD